MMATTTITTILFSGCIPPHKTIDWNRLLSAVGFVDQIGLQKDSILTLIVYQFQQ